MSIISLTLRPTKDEIRQKYFNHDAIMLHRAKHRLSVHRSYCSFRILSYNENDTDLPFQSVKKSVYTGKCQMSFLLSQFYSDHDNSYHNVSMTKEAVRPKLCTTKNWCNKINKLYLCVCARALICARVESISRRWQFPSALIFSKENFIFYECHLRTFLIKVMMKNPRKWPQNEILAHQLNSQLQALYWEIRWTRHQNEPNTSRTAELVPLTYTQAKRWSFLSCLGRFPRQPLQRSNLTNRFNYYSFVFHFREFNGLSSDIGQSRFRVNSLSRLQRATTQTRCA